jgi:hypothetical protein
MSLDSSAYTWRSILSVERPSNRATSCVLHHNQDSLASEYGREYKVTAAVPTFSHCKSKPSIHPTSIYHDLDIRIAERPNIRAFKSLIYVSVVLVLVHVPVYDHAIDGLEPPAGVKSNLARQLPEDLSERARYECSESSSALERDRGALNL